MDPIHLLHQLKTNSAQGETLRSRQFFVLKAHKLTNELSQLSIRAAQWTD